MNKRILARLLSLARRGAPANLNGPPAALEGPGGRRGEVRIVVNKCFSDRELAAISRARRRSPASKRRSPASDGAPEPPIETAEMVGNFKNPCYFPCSEGIGGIGRRRLWPAPLRAPSD